MRKLYLFAAMAAMLAACSENDLTADKQVVQQNAGEGALVFDAYVNRGITRAGKTGVIDNSITGLQASKADGGGFGVFGYYTNSERYSGITKPNYFYNQLVEYSGGRWTYSPLKYWPNEFGSDAISDQVDRVSMFAYAPWVDVDPLTGIVKKQPTKNIISMTRNNVTGDPFIRYSATMDPTNCTDLLYGVAYEDFTSSNSAVNVNDVRMGYPYKDLVKPGTDAKSKIFFDFKHALAQLKVTINANVVDLTSPSDEMQTSKTRIWVRSVKFEGITQEGSLNLNSVAPDAQWYDINGINKITTGTLTVYDGLKDEREPLEEAATEYPATFNEQLIQKEKYSIDGSGNITNAKMGVTKEPKNLFNGDFVFAIPTGEKMKVTIVYDVETYDPNLAFYLSDGETQGSTIENKITKTIDTFGSIKAGYCYNLNLHLGMRTVDFDAAVTGWQDVAGETNLPSNLPTFAVSSPEPERTVILPNISTTYEFAVSGLTPGSTPTVDDSNYTGGGTVNKSVANASGVSNCSIEVTTASNDTKRLDRGYITISDATTSSSVKIYFKQSPLPLVLGLNDIKDGDNKLTISVNTSLKGELKMANAIANDGTIEIYKNGVKLSEGTPGYTLSGSNLDITLNGTAQAKIGDIYTVYIQSGDATAENVTKTVGASFTLDTSASPIAAAETESDADITVTATTEFNSTNYEVSATKDGTIALASEKVVIGTGKVTLKAPAADYNTHTYVVTVTKKSTGENHSVTLVQNPVTISMGTPSISAREVTMGAITVTPDIEWSWTGTTITVYNSSEEILSTGYTKTVNGSGVPIVTFESDGTYKIKVTKGEVSTPLVSVTVPGT